MLKIFFGVLAAIFIAMKLAGIGAIASWSWWLVLAPFWTPIVATLAVLAGVVMYAYYQVFVKDKPYVSKGKK